MDMYECDWLYKTHDSLKQHRRESFPYKATVREKTLLENTKNGICFDCVQCVIRKPDNLQVKFAKLLPSFKKINVSRTGLGPQMKEYAERGELPIQPRRMLITSYFMEHGTIITL